MFSQTDMKTSSELDNFDYECGEIARIEHDDHASKT